MAIYVCRRVSESMKPLSIKLCTIFLLGIFVANTESSVSIEVHGLSDTNGSYSCNTSVVLTCEITGYTDSMEWRINGDLKSDCFLTDCFSYPPFPGNYSFTNDIAPNDISIFNVTINPLTLSDRGKSFVCSAESLSDSVSLQVTAKNDEYDISYTDNKYLHYMDASTGCFSSDTKVKFIWRKIKDMTNETSVYENDDEVELPCTSGCIDSGKIKRKSTLKIKGDDYGDRFRFQVEVIYENASHNNAVYNFGTTYILKGPCRIKCDKICIKLIVIGVCFFIDVTVGCSLLYVTTKKDESTEKKMDTSHIEIILNTVSTILWIVIVVLFILALRHCCSCGDPCCCCEIVLILCYVLGILFGTLHLILWLILMYVLYNRKDAEDGEGNIYFKTKLMKVRIAFSTIPIVGLFPVCGWLIRIYRYGNRTINDKQVTSEKKNRKLPLIPEHNFTINRTEDKVNKSQKKVKKEQDKIDQSFKKTIDSSNDREEKVKEDQISTSEITIVKPKKTDTKDNVNIQKSTNTRNAHTNSVTLQLSPKNKNVLTRSQDHNKEHGQNMTDNQHYGPHTDENSQRKVDVTNKQSGPKKKSDSKDEVKPLKRKSKIETDENKSTKSTEFISIDARTGNTQMTKTGSNDQTDSGDDASPPSHISKSDNTVPKRKKSRKNKNKKEGPNNTKLLNAESHNRNTQVTKTGSDDQPDSGDDASPSNISKSDSIVPNGEKSIQNKKEKEGPNNAKPLSAEVHNRSETMKRALSATFHDETDDTPTVSIDYNTNM